MNFFVSCAKGLEYLLADELLAMGLPIITALIGVGIGIMGIGILAAFTDLSSTAPTLATMIGLAVGIDYSLFIVSRHRDQLATGMDAEESAARATALRVMPRSARSSRTRSPRASRKGWRGCASSAEATGIAASVVWALMVRWACGQRAGSP